VNVAITLDGGVTYTQALAIEVADVFTVTTIDFEGLAPQDDYVSIPDGYKNLQWSPQSYAADDGFDAGTYMTALTSGQGTGWIYPDLGNGFWSTESDFDLVSGFFASHGYDAAQTVVVQGWDDGEVVATRTLNLTRTAEYVELGDAFRSIDAVKFIDTEAPNHFIVDDIVLRYDDTWL
jgi:hypothetical protein